MLILNALLTCHNFLVCQNSIEQLNIVSEIEKMVGADKSFRLRYVGARFNGARLPLDMLSDLPAFRDLIVSYAKDRWRTTHQDRERLPKGFDKSISFDLVAIEEGSAVPKLIWSRRVAQEMLPGFVDELELLVNTSYETVVKLVDDAGQNSFPSALSSEHVRALNKLGSGLHGNERIEFLDSQGKDGQVVYLDTYRRKALITRVRETYESRFEGVGKLVGLHLDGFIQIMTQEHGELKFPVDKARIQIEFDGNTNADVQFSLQIELDNNDKFKSVVDVFDVEIVAPELSVGLSRCNKRIEELNKLVIGWHNGSGAAISPKATAMAQKFLSGRPNLADAYRIYPTLEGGILFEFEINEWDFSVEIRQSGQLEMFGIQLEGAQEHEPELFDDIEAEFLSRFDQLTKSEISR